eukprot:PhF_6_TR19827/c0_g1_i1/m.28908/K07018/K07018; uncharacterized protein
MKKTILTVSTRSKNSLTVFVKRSIVHSATNIGKGNNNNAALPAAIVMHPLASAGGCSQNPVVTALCRCVEANGFASVVYDMPAVGSAKAAKHAPPVLDDASDVVDVAKEVLKSHPGVLLVGYSYGAVVAGCALKELLEHQVLGYVGVAYPTRRLSDLMQPSHHGAVLTPLQQSNVYKLFIHGSEDPFVNMTEKDSFYGSMKSPKFMEEIKGVNHFWPKRSDLETLASTLTRHIPKLR